MMNMIDYCDEITVPVFKEVLSLAKILSMYQKINNKIIGYTIWLYIIFLKKKFNFNLSKFSAQLFISRLHEK